LGNDKAVTQQTQPQPVKRICKDLEQAFDDGEDILESLDLSKAKRSMQDQNQQV